MLAFNGSDQQSVLGRSEYLVVLISHWVRVRYWLLTYLVPQPPGGQMKRWDAFHSPLKPQSSYIQMEKMEHETGTFQVSSIIFLQHVNHIIIEKLLHVYSPHEVQMVESLQRNFELSNQVWKSFWQHVDVLWKQIKCRKFYLDFFKPLKWEHDWSNQSSNLWGAENIHIGILFWN